ncbi:MAG: hypothetical protein ACOZIN_19325 [Myxococcota bacterium]
MLAIDQATTIEQAGRELLDYILEAKNWVSLARIGFEPTARPGQNPAYQRRVGSLWICASVDVTPTLEVYLRVAFRGANLSPMKAADCLESFLSPRIPFLPNSEWRVEIDSRRWIHFIRPYVGERLEA